MSLIFGLRPALTVLLIKITVLSSIGYINTVEAANPTFLVPIGSTASRSVSEDGAPSTSILTLEGQDTDGDTLTFSIVTQVPISPPFELESVTGLLKVPSGLNAELYNRYVFVFGVRDGSTTTNSVSYAVNIEDVNDNIPQFVNPPYNGSVHESDPVGTEVLTVTAIDGDITAPNNEVTFSLSGDGNANFAINDEGSVTLQSKLDPNSTTTYNLTITATDKATSNRLSSTATLTITFNRNPTFLVPYPDGSNGSVSVNENSPIRTSIFTLIGQDADGDTLTYSIVSQEPNNPMFQLESDTGVLRAPNGLNAETNRQYTFTFGVSDGTATVNSTQLTVNINDVNDNTPTFTNTFYNVRVRESANPGTVILTVTATDEDFSSPNNLFTFSLTGDGSDHFEINSTGSITVKSQLDYSNKPSYNLTITATDKATTNQLSSSANLQVTAETAPKFTNPPRDGYVVQLNKDKEPSTTFFTFEATDEDGAPDIVTYSLISVDPPPGAFSIDGASLKTSASVTSNTFDPDVIANYTLGVIATDGKYNASTNLIILITDRTPTFTMAEYSANVLETKPLGEEILRVTAIDWNSTIPANGFMFSLSGQGNAHFAVDADGSITVSSQALLDYITRPKYTLTITVTDNDNKLSASVPLSISLETAPTFTKPADAKTVQNITENTPGDFTIFTCEASDEDGSPGQITYSMVSIEPSSGTSLFEMDGATLKSKADISSTAFDVDAASAVQDYTVVISASDGKYTSEATLTVHIEDINDNSPRFTKPADAATVQNIYENITGDISIFTFEVTDDDISPVQITYSVVSIDHSSEASLFVMDGATLKSKADISSTAFDVDAANAVQDYTVVISAFDGNYNTSTNLTVHIQDINDNRPMFTQDIYHFNRNETLSIGVAVVMVTATDADVSAAFSALTYSISAIGDVQGHSPFEIDQQTGTVTLISQLMKVSYTFTVTARDSGNQTGSTTVNITVLDVHEKVISVNITNAPFENCDVNDQLEYAQLQENTKTAEEMRFPAANIINVTGLRCGSLSYELAVTFNATYEATSLLVRNLIDISNGQQLTVDGQSMMTTALSVNGNPIPIGSTGDDSAKICYIYTTISPCESSQYCQVDNGNPYCKDKDSDNLGLIIGLAVGIPVGLAILICIAVFVRMRFVKTKGFESSKHRKHEKPTKSRRKENRSEKYTTLDQHRVINPVYSDLGYVSNSTNSPYRGTNPNTFNSSNQGVNPRASPYTLLGSHRFSPMYSEILYNSPENRYNQSTWQRSHTSKTSKPPHRGFDNHHHKKFYTHNASKTPRHFIDRNTWQTAYNPKSKDRGSYPSSSHSPYDSTVHATYRMPTSTLNGSYVDWSVYNPSYMKRSNGFTSTRRY